MRLGLCSGPSAISDPASSKFAAEGMSILKENPELRILVQKLLDVKIVDVACEPLEQTQGIVAANSTRTYLQALWICSA